MCDMTHPEPCKISVHPYVWHESFSVWHDSFICVPWLIHACDMTYPEPCKILLDSSMCDMTHSECDITHSVCNMIHSYVQHGSFIHLTWLTQGHAILLDVCQRYFIFDKRYFLGGWKQGSYDDYRYIHTKQDRDVCVYDGRVCVRWFIGVEKGDTENMIDYRCSRIDFPSSDQSYFLRGGKGGTEIWSIISYSPCFSAPTKYVWLYDRSSATYARMLDGVCTYVTYVCTYVRKQEAVLSAGYCAVYMFCRTRRHIHRRIHTRGCIHIHAHMHKNVPFVHTHIHTNLYIHKVNTRSILYFGANLSKKI